jgi:hypothetical protein
MKSWHLWLSSALRGILWAQDQTTLNQNYNDNNHAEQDTLTRAAMTHTESKERRYDLAE